MDDVGFDAPLPKGLAGGPDDGVVYLVQAGPRGGPVKIGYSRTPLKRIRKMQTGNPRRLRLLAVIDGPRSLERRIQETFKLDRVNGEWFRPSADMFAAFDLPWEPAS